ncbi:MAG: phosphohistidine phosphatase SixA [Calditrichia bacterium]|nr:phosphohistidine phosphatase SixA [Calditrichia bacterium]
MCIYLVQHGKSYTKDLNTNRPLTPEGKKETIFVANQIKNKDVKISKIIHSNKTRTIETANIFSETLDPDIPTSFEENLNPNDDITVFAEQLNKSANLMVVSHLPFLSKLASFLLTGTIDNPIIAFKNSGVICLKFENNNWIIEWIVVP